MTDETFIGAIDQGTTSTRFMVFNRNGETVASSQMEHRQYYPKPGWVEHDPEEIYLNTVTVMRMALREANIPPERLHAIGITNQRETTVVFDAVTGKPYCRAIVWQDTRTDRLCREMAQGDIDRYRKITGLPLATYFSGPKLKWFLSGNPEFQKGIEAGRARFGTIDTWLLWRLTGGPSGGIHITDVTNASRTMLMNLETLQWDAGMLDAFGLPEKILPEIRSSSEVYGTLSPHVLGHAVPVSGILGDQQAALFGQACFDPGEAKNTYGTGCFLLLNTGEKKVDSEHGLITTVAYRIQGQKPVYALEGSIALAGSLVQWFRDNFGLIKSASEIEAMAASVEDAGGIYFVPAFSGLFAPHWKSDARGLVIGLTHYIHKGHLARAVLEASAYQTREIFEAMASDAGIRLQALKVDGGMVENQLLMQFQADILNTRVIRPAMTETTVLGAAYAAGLATGFWNSLSELRAGWRPDMVWKPNMPEEERSRRYRGWLKAVSRACDWVEDA